MEHSRSSQANNSADHEDLPAFYAAWRFITVFTTACNLPPSLATSIQSMPPHPFLNTHCQVILPSTHKSLPFRFPHQNPGCISPPPHPCHPSHPSHRPWFYHPNNTWRAVQIMQLLITQFLQPCVTSPCPNIFLSTLQLLLMTTDKQLYNSNYLMPELQVTTSEPFQSTNPCSEKIPYAPFSLVF